MARVVQYDPITNYVVSWFPSANTPDWEGRANTLINPVIPDPIIPITDMIHDNGIVREMTQGEKDTRDAARQSKDILDYRQLAKEYFNENKVMREALKLLLNEINILRIADSLPTRTNKQFFDAIITKIDNGDVD